MHVKQVAVGRFKRLKIDEISRLHETLAVGENFTRSVRTIFGEFQRKVVEEVKMNGWDGKDYDNDDDAKLQWSFAGALLYAVTVVTTIGQYRIYTHAHTHTGGHAQVIVCQFFFRACCASTAALTPTDCSSCRPMTFINALC